MAGECAASGVVGFVQMLIGNGLCQPGVDGSDLSICPNQALGMELLGNASLGFVTPPKVHQMQLPCLEGQCAFENVMYLHL